MRWAFGLSLKSAILSRVNVQPFHECDIGMTTLECEQNSITATGKLPNSGVPWLVLGLPILIAGLIFFVSPNFRTNEELRTAPLGGDFLQERIGATVLSGEQASQLYDAQYIDALQHDS